MFPMVGQDVAAALRGCRRTQLLHPRALGMGGGSAGAEGGPRLPPGPLRPPSNTSQCHGFVTCVLFSLPLLLLLVGLPFIILTARHSPFRRGFFCNDDSIKYPYKEDTISYQLLGGVMIPVTILTVSATVLLSVCTSLSSASYSLWLLDASFFF